MNTTERFAGASAPQLGYHEKNSAFQAFFSFPVLLGALLIAAVFFGTLSQESKNDTLFSEGDTWWHIRAGDDILSTHKFPHIDTYSWTAAGTPWIAYEWLGEIAIAESYRIGGLQGLRLLQLVLAGTMLSLLYLYASMRCGNPKAAFVVCTVIVPVAAGFWSLRPQLFGFILFIIVLLVIEQFRRGKKRALWVLPPLFAIWVNTHGSFVFGFLALGIVWISGLRRMRLNGLESFVLGNAQRIELGVVSLISVSGLVLTPYHSALAAYPFDIGFFQPSNIANIQEWMPITKERFLAATVLLLLLALFLSKILLRYYCRLDDLAFVTVTAIAAFLHLRFVPLFLLVTVPVLALPLSAWFAPYSKERDRAHLNAVLIGLVLVALVYFFPSKEDLETVCAEHFPVAALQQFASFHGADHIFNEYGWGGYLSARHFPSEGVFIDGRADIYERTGVLADYLSIARLEPNGLRLLDKYNIGTCFIRADSPLGTVLSALPGWKNVYHDEVTLVFLREASQVPTAIQSHTP